ncbi:hypothetical protein [Sphingomonas sp. NPDC079357]
MIDHPSALVITGFAVIVMAGIPGMVSTFFSTGPSGPATGRGAELYA